ncbi:hypothetical protein E4T39_08088 [Aureobasidium subglaciale]|nr:hypothetical protein E4T39_08088 [Aureobasidium subglaciale]
MTAATNRRGQTSTSVHKKAARLSEGKKDKKEKKYVTTNSIFKSGPDRIRKRARSSPKDKRSGLGKSILRRELSSSPPPRKRYTLADESNEVLNNYRSHVSVASEQMIALAYEDLIQQLEQTTLAPDGLSARIAGAIEAANKLSTPLANELVRVNFKDAKGVIIRKETIPIGDTVTKFEQILQDKEKDLETLWEEWDHVCQAIAETGAEILHEPTFPLKFGLETIEGRFSPSAHANPEVESLRRLIKRESDKAHKELDQEAKDSIAAHKTYMELWIRFINEQNA